MTFVLYAGSNIFCIIILAAIYYQLSVNIGQQTSIIMFKRVALSMIFMVLLDIAWEFFYIYPVPQEYRILVYLVNVAYSMLSNLVMFFWLFFVGEQTYGTRDRKRFSRFLPLLLLPIIASGLITMTTCFNGCIFSFDAEGHYIQGPLYILFLAIPYIYVILSTVDIALDFRTIKNRQDKKSSIMLFAFIIFPTLGVLVGYFFTELPAIWPMFTFALLIVFFNLQNEQMSMDGLTGINNRRRFDNYLDEKLEKAKDDGSAICLIMSDLDEFKKINDTFGHNTGDEALKETADILMEICNGNKTFFARYGGDEFAIIHNVANETEAKEFLKEIRTAFESKAKKENTEYKLSLSTGMGFTSLQNLKGAAELIKEADHNLYKEKRSRK